MAAITTDRKTAYSGDLILVTPAFAIEKEPEDNDMQPAIPAQPDIKMQKHAAIMLDGLLREINAGDSITAVSGYRPQSEQQQIWDDCIKESGIDFTRKFVAVPGHSEHQTGLAIDLAEKSDDIDFIRPAFPRAGICAEFRKAAPRFGFIERYKAGKEPVTGINAEEWHFRYVGYPHSAIISEKGMSLEEYISFLKENTSYKYPYIYKDEYRKTGASARGQAACRPDGTEAKTIEISYISLDEGCREELTIPDGIQYSISGTNEGGAVLTVWK